jgi:SAM-dependent methyltransferase
MEDNMETSGQIVPIGMGIDSHALLFRSKGSIIRAIHNEYADFYRELAGSPLIKKLIDDSLLIKTEISSTSIEGHDLVLEHPLLPTISYPFEWTPSMFKDASKLLLKLNMDIISQGLCTHEAHLWNVLFNGTTPIFVDFTSLIKLPPDGRWRGLRGFEKYCLNPLLLMSKGIPTTTRFLMREIFSYPEAALVNVLCGKKEQRKRSDAGQKIRAMLDSLPVSISDRARSIARLFRDTKIKIDIAGNRGLREIESLHETIEKLDIRPHESKWSDYYEGKYDLPVYDGTIEKLNMLRTATAKHSTIDNLLTQTAPKTVLDLGCNRGLYSQMAALKGARVVGIDTDENALDHMYLDSRALGTNALPLFVNAVAPAEAIGFKEKPFPSVTERLRADFVLCLALVHHLVFKSTHMSFEHIAKVLSSYSNKYVLVEFIPKEDAYIKNWPTDKFPWYTLGNFEKELHRHFSHVKVFESFPSPRVLLFCEK